MDYLNSRTLLGLERGSNPPSGSTKAEDTAVIKDATLRLAEAVIRMGNHVSTTFERGRQSGLTIASAPRLKRGKSQFGPSCSEAERLLPPPPPPPKGLLNFSSEEESAPGTPRKFF